METTVFQRPAAPPTAELGSVRISVIFALSVWFLLVVSLGAGGVFVGPPGKPPIAIAIGVGAPLLLFFASLQLSRSFREFILSLDLCLVTGMQAWRFEGFGFLALYAHHVLPGAFALTAGIGDMAIGLAAPWMILGLVRQPEFATSAVFVRWNILGILDLAIAVCIAVVSAMLAGGVAGEVSTAPMSTLPLLLIPAFQVPLFLILHVTALMQSRQTIRVQPGAEGKRLRGAPFS